MSRSFLIKSTLINLFDLIHWWLCITIIVVYIFITIPHSPTCLRLKIFLSCWNCFIYKIAPTNRCIKLYLSRVRVNIVKSLSTKSHLMLIWVYHIIIVSYIALCNKIMLLLLVYALVCTYIGNWSLHWLRIVTALVLAVICSMVNCITYPYKN